MAGLGFKDFQVGEVLTSSDVDGYLMQQTVMRFADAGARGSALGTATGTAVALAEGMVTYLDDGNALQVYDGTGWTSPLPGIGANVVDASFTSLFSTSSGSYVDVATLTITPSSASSKILIIGAGSMSLSSSNVYARIVLTDNSNTILYQGDAAGSRGQSTTGIRTPNIASSEQYIVQDWAFYYLHSPATTSATTYKLRALVSGASTLYLGTSDGGDDDSVFTARVPTSFLAVEVAA